MLGVSEGHYASIFTVTEFVQVDPKMILWKKMEAIASSKTSEYIIMGYRNPTDDYDLIKAMFETWNFRIWTGFS
jgi:hypothetical protein